MRFRSVVARPARFATVALLAAAVSCSTSDEVVFEGTPAPPPEGSLPGTTSGGMAGPEEATTVATTKETTVSTTAPPATTIVTTGTAGTGRATTPPVLTISDRRIETLPGQIVVSDMRTGSVTILGPQAGMFETFANPGEDLHQPTWSPDGALVAWSRATDEGFSVVVSSNTGDGTTAYETPFSVFYMQWRPDGRAIGLLGATEAGRVGLAILDLDHETVTPLNSSSSYYFHWSSEGDRIITHLGGTGLELLDPSTGDTSLLETLDQVDSGFQAAEWTPDGLSILYVRPAAPDSVGAPDELVIHHLETGEIDVVGEGAGFFNFAVSPDGKAIAYSIRTVEGVVSVAIFDLVTGRTEEIGAPLTLAWQWSPDSRKILLLGVGENALTVNVYEGGRITRYQDMAPTNTFLQNYLFFWSQYDLSHSLWAPDSSAFVFPAFDRNADTVFLQYLNDEYPILLGPGSMAVFSPATPGP